MNETATVKATGGLKRGGRAGHQGDLLPAIDQLKAYRTRALACHLVLRPSGEWWTVLPSGLELPATGTELYLWLELKRKEHR